MELSSTADQHKTWPRKKETMYVLRMFSNTHMSRLGSGNTTRLFFLETSCECSHKSCYCFNFPCYSLRQFLESRYLWQTVES